MQVKSKRIFHSAAPEANPTLTIYLVAQGAGVAPEVFVDVLAQGGGAGVALERLRPYLLAQDASALRFALGNALKDMGYYTTMAGDSRAACQIAQAVQDTFASAVSQAGADAPVPELVRLLVRKD